MYSIRVGNIAILCKHIKEYLIGFKSLTNLIISLACGLLQTRLVYVIDNIKGYKVLLLDLSLMVNKI